MMKKYLPILIMLLLLTACQSAPRQAESPTPEPTPTPAATSTPTPEPTPAPTAVGIELDVGDGEHRFWVELVEREEELWGIWVNIYHNKEDTEPVQQFEDYALRFDMTDLTAEDVDFDGKTDFHFVRDYGSLPGKWTTYYVWDEKNEQFVIDPYGLNDLPTADFDPESQIITLYWHYDAIGGRRVWCRYIDDKLTCVRCLEASSMEEDGSRLLRVWDRRDEELVKVWEMRDPKGTESNTDFWKALSRWENLDYPARQEVKVDKNHTFWVELVDTGEPEADCNKLLVNIYRDETGKELFQTFESWWADPYGLYCFPVEDMDFDGDMDFAVCNIEYRSNHQKSHYIWDGEQERFVEDPYGLNDLCNTHFDEERQVVRTNQGSVTGETTEYYQYRQGSLVCIRSLYRQYWSEDNTMHLKVEDEVDGVLITVYEEKIPFGELPKGELWTEEFERWENPDYPGK